MKLDFARIDRNIFNVRLGKVGDLNAYLVEPHYSGGSEKWTTENLCLRSSVWTEKGELISAGFPKFFNFFIDPETNEIRTEHKLARRPKNLKDWRITDKKDGSLLIVSKYKGQLIVRTRGTFNYSILSNAEEMEYLREVYPKVFSFFNQIGTTESSFLFEWYSPKNKIVINYGDYPKLWLIGAVNHKDYSLWSQAGLDALAKEMQVERPEYYDLGDLTACRECVEAMVGKEGVVMYPPNGQNPVKLKSPRYWALHAMKEGVSSVEKVIDIWLGVENPSFQSVYKFIFEKYDFEIAEYATHFISKVADAAFNVKAILIGMENFIILNKLREKSDKEAYHKVYESYGAKSNRAGMVMNLRKGKALSKDSIKKLFLQILKNKVK